MLLNSQSQSDPQSCPKCGSRIERVSSKRTRRRCPVCEHTFSLKSAETSSNSSIRRKSPSNRTAEPKEFIGELGRFQLVKAIGSGAFGIVYQASDPVLDRQVALKVPKVDLSKPRRMRRFIQEAKTAARLHHPNIVAIFDSGKTEAHYFIAFEFIEGWTLTSFVKEQSPSREQLVAWLRDLAFGLAYAHQAGIVHRDLKPDNILVDRRQMYPKIADFGLAKILDEDSSLQTQEGSIIGTPAYMSPEQARGDLNRVGPSSDLYSLGSVMFELLTGQRPYRGAPHSILAELTSLEESPRIEKLQPNVPRDLTAICTKAMEKEPARRYETCGEFAADLNRWLSGEPVHARPIRPWTRFYRWSRRNPLVAGSLSTVLTVLVVAMISISIALRTASEERANAVAAQQATEAAAYRPNVMLAHREYQSHRWSEARKWLQACPESSRHWEWNYLEQQLRSRVQATLSERCFIETNSNEILWDPIKSHPDGQSFFMDLDGRDFGQFSFADGRLIQRFDRQLEQSSEWADLGVLKFCVSPQGDLVATLSNRFCREPKESISEFAIWNANTGELVDRVLLNECSQLNDELVCSRHQSMTVDADFSKFVLFQPVYRDESYTEFTINLHHYSFANGKLAKQSTIQLSDEYRQFDGAGRFPFDQEIVVQLKTETKTGVYKIDPNTGAVSEVVSLGNPGDWYRRYFDYNPTNDRLVFIRSDEGRIYSSKLDGSAQHSAQVGLATRQNRVRCALSRDGDRVITWADGNRDDKMVRVWSLPELQLMAEFADVENPIISCLGADGTSAVTVGAKTTLWKPADFPPNMAKEWSENLSGRVRGLKIDEQWQTFLVASRDGQYSISLRDGSSKKLSDDVPPKEEFVIKHESGPLTGKPIGKGRIVIENASGKYLADLRVGEDNRMHAVGPTRDNTIFIYDEGFLEQGNIPGELTATGANTHFLSLDTFLPIGKIEGIGAVKVTTDGRWMFAHQIPGLNHLMIELRHDKGIVEEMSRHGLPIAPQTVQSVAFLPDGSRFFTGTRDGRFIVWETDTATELLSIAKFNSAVHDIHVSPTGRYVIAWDSNRYQVFDAGVDFVSREAAHE